MKTLKKMTLNEGIGRDDCPQSSASVRAADGLRGRLGIIVPTRFRFAFVAVVILCLLSSCQTTGSSASQLTATSATNAKPTAQTLKLKSEVSFGDGVVLKKITLPAGEYQYLNSDKRGHYYTSVQPVKVFDIPLSYTTTGGIFWKKGLPTPTHGYWTAPFGNKANFKADFSSALEIPEATTTEAPAESATAE